MATTTDTRSERGSTRSERRVTPTETGVTRTDRGGRRIEKGPSLARGPALLVGTILLAAGLYSLYRQHFFLPFSDFPNGNAPVNGKVFGVFGANGWTGMFTAVAGGVLMFGAAQHHLAKTMSLIVGGCLGAAAIIGAISSNVLGMAASNAWTEIAWGIAAAILLLNVLIPRRTTVVTADGRRSRHWGRTRTVAPAAVGAGAAGGAAYEAERDRAPARADRPLADRPVEGDRAPVGDTADRERVNGEPRTRMDEEPRTTNGESRTVAEEPLAAEAADEPEAAEEPESTQAQARFRR
jgi:hypothetical protein